jgi:hypothetical protein
MTQPIPFKVTTKAVRLSPPMIELLTDITTKPMYITLWSPWDRTAEALVSRGLAERPRGYAGGRQYEIRITEAGRAEAARRGIPHERAVVTARRADHQALTPGETT